jgi:hypothetical protein
LLHERLLVRETIDLEAGRLDRRRDRRLGIDGAVLVAHMVDRDAHQPIALGQGLVDFVMQVLVVGRALTDADHGYRGASQGVVDETVKRRVAALARLVPHRGRLYAAGSPHDDVRKLGELLHAMQIPCVIEAEKDPSHRRLRPNQPQRFLDGRSISRMVAQRAARNIRHQDDGPGRPRQS